MRGRGVLGALLGVALLASACSSDGPSGTGTTATTGGLTGTTKPAYCRNDDVCYGRAQMKQVFDTGITLIVRFYDTAYAHMPRPAGFIYIVAGEKPDTACGAQDDTAYAFCPGDDKIYLGDSELWSLYSQFGLIGPITGLAHEWGHHVQHATNVPEPQTTDESIQHENQADCLAGAWVAFASSQNEITYPGDLQNVDGMMSEIASAEGPGRDHGTVEQRSRSFSLGYGGGLKSCNDYYPATPVYAAS